MTGDFLIVKKYLSNPLVTGTIFLTLAGTTSRFMGFFFRIFLNNVMGSTGLGLYQLVIPTAFRLPHQNLLPKSLKTDRLYSFVQ